VNRIADAPEIHNGGYWFEPDVVISMREIKGLIETVQRPVALDAGRLAFSRIIVRMSNQQGESVYRRVVKTHPPAHAWVLFERSIGEVVNTLRSAEGTLHSSVRATVHNEDCRTFSAEEKSCDLVVTSPPYLNSWDYSLYQKFRMLWLGFDPKSYSEVEIGNHLRTLRDGQREILRYSADINRVFQNLALALKAQGHCVFVNGESVVSGEIINTDEIIEKAANASGMKLVSKELRTVLGPHFGNHASMKSRKVVSKIIKKKTESILSFSFTRGALDAY